LRDQHLEDREESALIFTVDGQDYAISVSKLDGHPASVEMKENIPHSATPDASLPGKSGDLMPTAPTAIPHP
jgi:hypothetical protein